jgi:hypothetical protein
MLKKILTWSAIAFVVFFIAFRPGVAADAIGALGETASDIFEGVGKFFGGLVS